VMRYLHLSVNIVSIVRNVRRRGYIMPFPQSNIKNTEQAVAMGRKGGSVSSEKKKLAAYIRSMKRWGMDKDKVEKAFMMIQDANLSVVDWYKHVEAMDEMAKDDPKLHPLVAKMKQEWHKATHGEKIKTENVHHIVNWGDMLSNAEVRPKKDNQRDV
jgi:hypothetical protein